MSQAGNFFAGSGDGLLVLNYVSIDITPYVVHSLDTYISIDSTTGPITVQFPDIPTLGRVYIVKDKLGTAATNNITLTSISGTTTIDGSLTFVMNTAFETIMLIGGSLGYEIL